MKLEVFREKNKKQKGMIIGICGVVLLLAVVLVYRSFALYEEQKEFDVIKGQVPNYMSDYDVNIALTIDGVASTTFPAKGSNKAVSSIECDKGANGIWDYERWAPVILNATQTRTKCKINFVTK